MDSTIILSRLAEKTVRFDAHDCQQIKEILCSSTQDKQIADEGTLIGLLKVFAKAYWDSDETMDKKLLFHFLKDMKHLSQMAIITALHDEAKNFPIYVTIAKELALGLSQAEQENLEFYPVKIADEKIGTFISKDEYAYLQRHDKKCFISNNQYCRPIKLSDLQCFYDSLEIAQKTGKPIYFYLS